MIKKKAKSCRKVEDVDKKISNTSGLVKKTDWTKQLQK